MINNFLRTIIHAKKKEIEELKRNNNVFRRALSQTGGVAIIAEVKLVSPSRGILGKREEIVERVKRYEENRVAAISVVVDKTYFGGDYELIKEIKRVVKPPVLVKDFILDPIQVYKAKEAGVDAVLLIARIVRSDQLIELVNFGRQLGMAPVVEIDNEKDLRRVVESDVEIIAVNARNLDDFSVDVDRACRLLKKVPNDRIKLGFSGIKTRRDIDTYEEAGAKGVLVGTSLMKAKNIRKFISDLRDI